MPRKYTNIQPYRDEIYELHNMGLTHQEIGEKLGLTKSQIRKFFEREHRKERQVEAGITLKCKGRPPKDYKITDDMKINDLKYIIARKDSKIKRLEMENELMRDFLSLTERK